MTDRAVVEKLVRSLRQDLMPDLSDQQLEWVLAWLAGSQAGANAAEMNRLLGAAGENRDLTRHVFDQADVLLFADGKLCLRTAGLAAAIDQQKARRRFRLLLSAFHPDRIGWHADWLTPRFQAINLAYRRFKLAPAQDAEDLATTADPSDEEPVRPAPPRYRGIAPGSPKQPARWKLLAKDRWLGHKVVAVLSLLVVLPLLSWSLEGDWLSSLFQRGQADEPTVTATPSAGAPTVARMLEQWNLLLLAESSEAAAGSRKEEPLPTSEDPPAAEPEPPTEAPAPDPVPARVAEALAVGHCQPTGLASRFDTWLAVEQGWSQANAPVGARPSRLRPGAIDGHALADTLENYRRSVEAGNMAQLKRHFVDKPRANLQQGERWLQEAYGSLFDGTTRRSLSLSVIEAYRYAEGWNVVTRYHLGVRLPDCPTDYVFEHELRFHLVQDPLLLRIAAVDY